MKRLLCALVLLVPLSGCASWMASIQNPINLNELATIESTYGVALSAAVAYRSLPLCKRDDVPSFSNVCAKRDVVLRLQEADRKAQAAILVANTFVKDNPTLSAVSAISAAQKAVTDFQTIESSYGVVQ